MSYPRAHTNVTASVDGAPGAVRTLVYGHSHFDAATKCGYADLDAERRPHRVQICLMGAPASPWSASPRRARRGTFAACFAPFLESPYQILAPSGSSLLQYAIR